MKTLRPYQDNAVRSFFDWFEQGKEGNPLLVEPVGSGKSLINAAIIKAVHDDAPRTRIICLTHVKELLVQNMEELRAYYPTVDAGFYCASLGQKRLHNDVTFASIQSIHNKAARLNRPPAIIMIDEAHLISHNEATQYRKFINACLAMNPDLVVCGLTGTPWRADSGRLDEGENRLFDGVAHELPISWMIEQGYLCRPITPQTVARLSVDGVRTVKGDYAQGALEKAVDIDEKTQECVAEAIAQGQTNNRKKWLVFTAGVQHCEHVRDEFVRNGIACRMVTGETPAAERQETIEWFSKPSDYPKCLVNVAVLTTGFNVPAIDMLVFMRPTKSAVLYIQCVGRGIRTTYHPGMPLDTQEERLAAIAASQKPNCLLVDFGGVVETLGPIDVLEIRKKPPEPKDEDAEPGAAIMKKCPVCGTKCFAAQRYCYSCSYSFISDALSDKASGNAVVTMDEPPIVKKVLTITMRKHQKKGTENNPKASDFTLCVEYYTTSGSHMEWVCFNHQRGSYAHDKARAWHKKRLPKVPCPESVDEALSLHYPIPDTVELKREGKYFSVTGASFSDGLLLGLLAPIQDIEEYEYLGESIPF